MIPFLMQSIVGKRSKAWLDAAQLKKKAASLSVDRLSMIRRKPQATVCS